MAVPPLPLRAVCLLALAGGLAPAQDSLAARVGHALDQARPALLAHLKAASDPSTRPGELALLVLAAAHDGVDPADPVLRRAVQRLQQANPEETYDLALRLLVLEAMPSVPQREALAQRDAKELLQHRHHSGAFGYGKRPGGWDLSNTQYAALGLRAARALGVRIERSVWARLADEIGGQQDAYGGFPYGRGHSNRTYASMTAAGIAVLAICRQELAGDGPATAFDGRIERGWQWFARNAAAIGSPKERWSLYFHYGLERAAILCDVSTVGAVDWYEAGASMLVAGQLAGGGWQSHHDGHPGGHLAGGRGDAVPTAFAVLFLRRKFQKVTGPITPSVPTIDAIGRHSRSADVDACAAELVRRGMPAMHDVFRGLRSDVELQRRAAQKALQAIAGDGFGYDPGLDVDGNRDALRRAELWYLRHR